jgi:nitrate/TMAO reductase-like tetraheme cytochrome c subunit
MGANQPRPLGCKVTKNAFRSGARGQTPVSRQEADIATIENFAAAQETLAEAMKQRLKFKEKKKSCGICIEVVGHVQKHGQG